MPHTQLRRVRAVPNLPRLRVRRVRRVHRHPQRLRRNKPGLIQRQATPRRRRRRKHRKTRANGRQHHRARRKRLITLGTHVLIRQPEPRAIRHLLHHPLSRFVFPLRRRRRRGREARPRPNRLRWFRHQMCLLRSGQPRSDTTAQERPTDHPHQAPTHATDPATTEAANDQEHAPHPPPKRCSPPPHAPPPAQSDQQPQDPSDNPPDSKTTPQNLARIPFASRIGTFGYRDRRRARLNNGGLPASRINLRGLRPTRSGERKPAPTRLAPFRRRRHAFANAATTVPADAQPQPEGTPAALEHESPRRWRTLARTPHEQTARRVALSYANQDCHASVLAASRASQRSSSLTATNTRRPRRTTRSSGIT